MSHFAPSKTYGKGLIGLNQLNCGQNIWLDANLQGAEVHQTVIIARLYTDGVKTLENMT